MKIEATGQDFFVVGENIHCTRVLLHRGKRIGESAEGCESVLFPGANNTQSCLPIPESAKKTNDYIEGRVKHVGIAVRTAMAGQEPGASVALQYLQWLVDRQVAAGADFLDLNVDEVSIKHHEQIEAMQWLVKTVQRMTPLALSVDSSLIETIAAGLEAYDSSRSRPLLNSASLERKEALDLALRNDAKVVISGAGESGMPQNDLQRIDHASQMIDLALAKGIKLEDMHVDLLVFPISVDGAFGPHFLDAVRAVRKKYGPTIHLTGGMSNISFGLPCRGLINDVWVNLVVEAGCDGGIIDPATRDINSMLNMDKTTRDYAMARDVLLGRDRGCKMFLKAYRKGELAYTQPPPRQASREVVT